MPILDYDADAEQPWFVMPLASKLEVSGDRIQWAMDTMVKVSQHVADLHQEGIVHRDLKPNNILVLDGEVIVSDFGLARFALLGVRLGESKERDRTIERHDTGSKYFLNQGTSSTTKIFSPIIDYSVNDVWATLKYNALPKSINHSVIGQLYKDAGSECPVFRETKGTPCGKGRFGCWTCTVVRQDKSVKSMVRNGHKELQPLFTFRNWLSVVRDQPEFRCKIRRNGKIGQGPITLAGRKVILQRLLQTEKRSGLKLLEEDELVRIKALWVVDKSDSHYREY